jgi:uncharacterized OB-fold protein
MGRGIGTSRGNERFSTTNAKERIWQKTRIVTKPAGRKCKKCGSVLSIYNLDDNYCYAHQREEWRK